MLSTPCPTLRMRHVPSYLNCVCRSAVSRWGWVGCGVGRGEDIEAQLREEQAVCKLMSFGLSMPKGAPRHMYESTRSSPKRFQSRRCDKYLRHLTRAPPYLQMNRYGVLHCTFERYKIVTAKTMIMSPILIWFCSDCLHRFGCRTSPRGDAPTVWNSWAWLFITGTQSPRSFSLKSICPSFFVRFRRSWHRTSS